MEINPIVYQCAVRDNQMLSKNKSIKCPGPADRLMFIQWDALIMSKSEKTSFGRVLAHRPKRGDAPMEEMNA